MVVRTLMRWSWTQMITPSSAHKAAKYCTSVRKIWISSWSAVISWALFSTRVKCHWMLVILQHWKKSSTVKERFSPRIVTNCLKTRRGTRKSNTCLRSYSNNSTKRMRRGWRTVRIAHYWNIIVTWWPPWVRICLKRDPLMRVIPLRRQTRETSTST